MTTGRDSGTGSAAGTGARSDEELLAAHVAGDAAAFGELFGRHRDRLWAVALRTTGHREDAADALQDAMVSAFRRAETFGGRSAVTTWLHRIVVNACLDRMRAAKVRDSAPLPDDVEEYARRGAVLAGDGEGSTEPVDPADVVVADERRRAVMALLATLPDDARDALVLVDMEGLSVAEAAEVLGCAVGTVKSRCSRGRARLAALLREPGNRKRRPTVPPGEAVPQDPVPDEPEADQPVPEQPGSSRRPRVEEV